ncbi:MAG: hypothetical protein MI923_03070 [Phycisphaerales bacterium]|nr:hypothetical protein [Phycisphaerales bacterium]
MSTPGFDWLKNITKDDGTRERMEIDANNNVLKKYTRPNGDTYSSVQLEKQKGADFHQSIGQIDPGAGFRQIFGG